MTEIELRWFDDEGVTLRALDELPELRGRTGGFSWPDTPTWSETAERLLATEFTIHPMAVRDCRERNHISSTSRRRKACT